MNSDGETQMEVREKKHVLPALVGNIIKLI